MHTSRDEDETPTEPPGPDAPAIRRISWAANDDDEALALMAIVKAWTRMSTERRVLISALCRELDPMG